MILTRTKYLTVAIVIAVIFSIVWPVMFISVTGWTTSHWQFWYLCLPVSYLFCAAIGKVCDRAATKDLKQKQKIPS